MDGSQNNKGVKFLNHNLRTTVRKAVHRRQHDTETMEQTELTYNGTVITNPICFSVSESYNGKHYFMLRTNGYNYVDKGDGTYTGVKGSVKPGFYAMDDKTGEITFVSGITP